MMLGQNAPQVQFDPVPLRGGFDEETPSYELQPGALRYVINFACRQNGGYYRIPGYERFDGRAEPHKANFIAIDVELDDDVDLPFGTQANFGGMTGEVVHVAVTRKYVVISDFHGDLVDGADILLAGDVIGTVMQQRRNLIPRELSEFASYAADYYRTLIGKVPGVGPVRGVAHLNDTVYAVRDLPGGAGQCAIYESSSAGWKRIPSAQLITFSNLSGAIVPQPGDKVWVTKQDGTTEHVTIHRTVVTTGDINAGTATGYFVISATGDLVPKKLIFDNGQTAVVTSHNNINTPLKSGGFWKFTEGVFGLHKGERRLYGADGINAPIEFDGKIIIPMLPTLADSTQLDLTGALVSIAHNNHLFHVLDTSIVHSAIGDPYNYEVLLGAGEIALGGVGTDAIQMPGNQGTAALMVTTDNTTMILYGTSAANWNLISFNNGIGAKARSLQNLYSAFAWDAGGTTMMNQALQYGNFDSARITYNIRPFVKARQPMEVLSSLNRPNGEYRVHWKDGYGLYTTTGSDGSLIGHGIVKYLHRPTCFYDGQRKDGDFITVFGTEDGWVMRNDVGTSFDGETINANFVTNINSSKSPRVRKRYRRLVFEIHGTGYTEFRTAYLFDWNTDKILPHLFQDSETLLAEDSISAGSNWDSFVWDNFFWDGRPYDADPIELNGSGENIQLVVVCDSKHVREFTLNSAIYHFTPRRGYR